MEFSSSDKYEEVFSVRITEGNCFVVRHGEEGKWSVIVHLPELHMETVESFSHEDANSTMDSVVGRELREDSEIAIERMKGTMDDWSDCWWRLRVHIGGVAFVTPVLFTAEHAAALRERIRKDV